MEPTLELIIDVHHDGDVVLVLSNLAGIAKVFGLRVSSHALRFSSPVFNDMLTKTSVPSSQASQETILHLPDEDGDTMFLLCNALHLRNSALPHRLSPAQLRNFALAAEKYKCTNATGRASTLWFDYIYSEWPQPPLISMIEAAHLLDDAIFFSRFTSRWVLNSVHTDKSVWTSQETHPVGRDKGSFNSLLYGLVSQLRDRRDTVKNLLRDEVDLLVDPCAQSLAEETRHNIDVPPDENLSEELLASETRVPCVVDKEGAQLYLGALRDEAIWPSTRWSNVLKEVVSSITDFRLPEYDNADKCCFCEDVELRFANALDRVRALHRDRLWGLCLDCVKSGSISNRSSGCRVDHGDAAGRGKPLSLVTKNMVGGQELLAPIIAGAQSLVTPVTPVVSVHGADSPGVVPSSRM